MKEKFSKLKAYFLIHKKIFISAVGSIAAVFVIMFIVLSVFSKNEPSINIQAPIGEPTTSASNHTDFISQSSDIEDSSESPTPSPVGTPSNSQGEQNNDTTSSIPQHTSESKQSPTQKPDSMPSIPPVVNETPKSTESAPPEKPSIIPATGIQVTFFGYESANEVSAYVLGEPVYQKVYSGRRVQVGDTLILNVSCTPSNTTEIYKVQVMGGDLQVQQIGNTLRIRVLSQSSGENNLIRIYYPVEGQAAKIKAEYMFVADKAGDPFNELDSLLSDYAAKLGVNNGQRVEHGYTENDHSLSITGAGGAWDDIIYKSSPNWLQQCFWVIDEYKKMGFSKFSSVSSNTQVAFAGSK